MIASGGENAWSAEAENAIGRHPAVALCAVIGVPGDEWRASVHAVVVRKPEAFVTEEEIRESCRASVARCTCPKSVAFREQLPLSGAGNILKRELGAPFRAEKDKQVN
jgi:long-chain acyl-CoA synthetase